MTGETADRRPLAAEIHRIAAEMEDLIHRRTSEIHDSAERFQALVSAAAEIVWTTDADGAVQEDSPSWRAFTGQTYEQWKGWGWLDAFHPDDRERTADIWRRSVENKTIVHTEYRIRHVSGEWRWTLVRAVPLLNADGSVRGWVGMNTDITELKLAEQAARDSEERLRLAQAVANVGTFDWNIQTGVNIWTPELETMYGLAPGSFAGTQPAWKELVHPDDRAAASQQIEQAFATGLPTEGEWRVVWPDDSIHWLAGRFRVFCDETGKPLRLMGVNIDITQRKLAEQESRRLNAELEQRVRDRTAQLEATVGELRQALVEIKTLQGLLPICAWCKKIRDDKDYWHSVEDFITANTHARMTHGMCPECYARVIKEEPSAG